MEQFFSKMIINDKLIEECGVFGIFNSKEAAVLTTLGLHALQHRGKEGAGIVTFDGKNFNGVRAQGLVSNTFNKKEIIGQLPGKNAVGHVRYSTQGESIEKNIQPLFADLAAGGFACAHNGNLINAMEIRKELIAKEQFSRQPSDTETILQLVAFI